VLAVSWRACPRVWAHCVRALYRRQCVRVNVCASMRARKQDGSSASRVGERVSMCARGALVEHLQHLLTLMLLLRVHSRAQPLRGRHRTRRMPPLKHEIEQNRKETQDNIFRPSVHPTLPAPEVSMLVVLAVAALGWGPAVPSVARGWSHRTPVPISLHRTPPLPRLNRTAVPARASLQLDLGEYYRSPGDPRSVASPSERRRVKRAFQLRTQQAVSTLLRVAMPTILATVFGFFYFDNLSLFIRSFLDTGTVNMLMEDDAQFVQNFLTVIGLLFSILAGNAYSALYEQQVGFLLTLFVTLAFFLHLSHSPILYHVSHSPILSQLSHSSRLSHVSHSPILSTL